MTQSVASAVIRLTDPQPGTHIDETHRYAHEIARAQSGMLNFAGVYPSVVVEFLWNDTIHSVNQDGQQFARRAN